MFFFCFVVEVGDNIGGNCIVRYDFVDVVYFVYILFLVVSLVYQVKYMVVVRLYWQVDVFVDIIVFFYGI